MKTAVVTDGKYRASLAAVRALGEAGFRVVVTQTRAEATVTPASFVSRFAAETRWIPGSCREADYGTRLRELLEAYDHPVLFCTGADTLNLVSSRREELARAAQGETLSYMPEDYQVGVKMRYLFHDGAATLGYLRQGDWRRALAGVADFFRTPEALYRKDDKGAYRAYLRNSLKGR